jgi:Tfp pilus assembly protein PilN
MTSIGAVGLITFLSTIAVVNGRSVANDRKATLTDLQHQLDAVNQVVNAAANDKQQANARFLAVSAADSKRMRWDSLLDDLARAMPSGAWLSGLKAQSPTPVVAVPGATAASATPALPTAFVITGYTTSNGVLPRVLDRLAQLPMLTDVWLQQSDRAELGKKWAIQFTIAANLQAGVR